MTLAVEPLGADRIPAILSHLAQLRIMVFRDWPYLYDGSAEYEERYLKRFAESPGAVLVAAWDGDRLVGASTGSPLADHDAAFQEPMERHGYAPETVFYCAESVLMPDYRGQGAGHAFFDHREEHARALGMTFSAFCAVIRPDDHPMRPAHYRPLDPFWRARGYEPLAGAHAHYDWQDVGDSAESTKPMQIWLKRL